MRTTVASYSRDVVTTWSPSRSARWSTTVCIAVVALRTKTPWPVGTPRCSQTARREESSVGNTRWW